MTKEEIEKMAEFQFPSAITKEGCRFGFVKGYEKCQQDMANKKYTEEDMLKSFWAGVDCEAENGKNFEQFIKSLNKD
jgi:hypothetical protein